MLFRSTVPALVDMMSEQVVSDDSGDMLFDLATAWRPLHREGAPDLYPLNRRNSTDAWDAWLTAHVNAPHRRRRRPWAAATREASSSTDPCAQRIGGSRMFQAPPSNDSFYGSQPYGQGSPYSGSSAPSAPYAQGGPGTKVVRQIFRTPCNISCSCSRSSRRSAPARRSGKPRKADRRPPRWR